MFPERRLGVVNFAPPAEFSPDRVLFSQRDDIYLLFPHD